MKTMKQMQDEMLARARWDGGYPKAIHMIPGVIALARDAEHERKLRRSNLMAVACGIPLGIALPLLVLWLLR